MVLGTNLPSGGTKTSGAKIVGSCSGQFPYNASTSGSSAYIASNSYNINFINEDSINYDFLILTAWPRPIGDTVTSSSTSSSSVASGNIPIESVLIGSSGKCLGSLHGSHGSNVIFGNAVYELNYTIDIENKTLTLQSVEELSRYNDGNYFTCIAYKY